MIVGGFALLAAGSGIAIWTASVLGWRRMIFVEGEPPHPALPVLVFAGPYQFVRHPRALAVVLISLGGTLLGDPLPVWLCASLALGAVLMAIRRDRRLLARFGESYHRYRQAVPFLIPRPLRSS